MIHAGKDQNNESSNAMELKDKIGSNQISHLILHMTSRNLRVQKNPGIFKKAQPGWVFLDVQCQRLSKQTWKGKMFDRRLNVYFLKEQ